jgi:choline kinase
LKAIILAAGKGSRLGKLTKNIPKGMLKIHNKTLIERQIEIYRNFGIKDITIVTGYKNKLIDFSGINYIKNQDFEKTNMNESLFCASEKFSDSIIISYTDIIFEQKIIQQMLESSVNIGIAVNLSWKINYEGRTLHPTSEAENVLIDNEEVYKIKKNISKKRSNQKIGEFMGIMKLSKKGSKIMLQKYLDLKENHKGEFHNAKSLQNAYITDMLQEIIDSGFSVSPLIVEGEWYEIDTPQDLEKVEKSLKIN